jgi:hypothetical protein
MTEINPETVAIFGDVVDSVRRAFDEGGSVACMIVCETEDGERITFQAAGALDDQATVMKKLRRLFRRLKVARYVRVTKCLSGAVDACVHPSEDPYCGDGVMVLAVDRTSVGMCSIAEIKRGAGGKDTLGPWEPLEISGGRRTCLIKARHSSDATDRC